jgi:hypothetical protein
MSRAAIFSFLPILTKLLPESVTKIEKGRYYRNRFHEISEKWIREHRQEYRGNRTGDLQVPPYIKHIFNIVAGSVVDPKLLFFIRIPIRIPFSSEFWIQIRIGSITSSSGSCKKFRIRIHNTCCRYRYGTGT